MADMNAHVITPIAVNTPSIKTDTAALSANANRASWEIQNVGQNPIFVCLGGTASSTVYHKVLKGGSADSDGLGADWGQTGAGVYKGAITIAGTSPKYVILECLCQ